MTLIAAWKENGIPFLIGDFVVSRVGNFEAPHHTLPTRDDLEDVLPRDWYRQIVGLCQKVYKISDSFVVGWSDSQFIAGLVIEELFKTFGNKQPTLQQVREHLTSITEYTKPTCQLVGWLIENEKPYCFHWCSHIPRNFELDDKFIVGSGQEHFREIFTPTSTGGSPDYVDYALTRVGNLLGYEVLYGNNLWSLFGGGFQIAFLRNGLFTILPSVTYLFLYAKEDEDGVSFGSDQRILKYQYENQIMQVLELHTRKNAHASRRMHYIFPIDAKPDAKYIVHDNLSLISQYYCIFVDVVCQDKLHTEFVISVADDKKDPLLKILNCGEKIEVLALSETLYRTVMEYLRSMNRNKTLYKPRKWLV